MAERSPMRRALQTLGFVVLSVLLTFLAILPLDHLPGALPGPDLLLAVALLWGVRRPSATPIWAVAGVFLLADFMLMRPPGLMAAGVVLGTEYLRNRAMLTTEVPFVLEWAAAASMASAILIGHSAIMALFGVPAPALGALLVKVIGTVLVYPVLAGLAWMIFGLRRTGRADIGFGSRA